MVKEYHIENNFIVVISLQLLLLFQNIFACIYNLSYFFSNFKFKYETISDIHTGSLIINISTWRKILKLFLSKCVITQIFLVM